MHENRTGYLGVSFHKVHQKWQARVVFEGRTCHFGYYDSIIEAAKAYDRGMKRLIGQSAKLNFPEGK